ncbi:16692_t:CDS:2, partial [Racocetra persica]
PTSLTTPSIPASSTIPSTPIRLTSSTISPVITIVSSAISILRQRYPILWLSGSTNTKEEIETLVMINDELDKESDIQSKYTGSDIFESDKRSEDESEVKKESFDYELPLSETRLFDLKAA